MLTECNTGYYGTSQTQTFKENNGAGNDYLADVCKQWEAEAQKADVQRTVILRTGMERLSFNIAATSVGWLTGMLAGIVLAKEGGAVGKMLPVFNLFAGGPLGSGQQWCSWIHR